MSAHIHPLVAAIVEATSWAWRREAVIPVADEPPPPHGTIERFDAGCTCSSCRTVAAAHREAGRERVGHRSHREHAIAHGVPEVRLPRAVRASVEALALHAEAVDADVDR